MNVKRKEAAVKKYAPMFNQGVTVEELGNLLGQDEKAYTAEEINEIRAAIIGNTEAPAASIAPETKKEAKEVVTYEEWRMERVGDSLQKLKLVRKGIKITDEEAETLNAGAKSPGAVNPIMYFKTE